VGFNLEQTDMKLSKRTSIATIAAAAAFFFAAGAAQAAATIINPAGTVALGVNDLGHLNTSVGSVTSNAGGITGLAYRFADGSFRDATAPGCLCEGWGVSVNGTTAGYANVAGGTAGLGLTSFASTATTATSSVFMTALSGLKVTHAYSPANNAPGALFKAVVTITNDTTAAVNNVKYVRVMDWDVPPTEFDEFVTIKGTVTTSLLERSHNDGFASSNPLIDSNGIDPGTLNVDFTDNGPTDHGAYFRFNFGTIAAGASYTFTTFYGAAGTEADALAAIGAESIELYSLGQSSSGGQITGSPATFIFGFAGVGGTPVEPPIGVPEPGSLALAGLALAGLGFARRRKASAV